MRKSLQKNWLLYTPLLLALIVLGPFALDFDVTGHDDNPRFEAALLLNLVPAAFALLLAQATIWLVAIKGRWGWRRTLLAAVGLVVVLVGWRAGADRLSRRGTRRAVVVASPTIYRAMNEDFSFAVSPDEHWLLYARETSDSRDEFMPLPEIVLRDLETGDERIVEMDEADAGEDFTVAEQIVWELDRPHWDDGAVRFERGRGDWVEISLATAEARRRKGRQVTPLRPSQREVTDYLRQRRGEVFRLQATAWDGVSLGRFIVGGRTLGTPRRRIGLLERREQGTANWVTLARHRGTFEDWSVSEPAVSPDERFAAYVGNRGELTDLYLMILIPLLGMGGIPDDHFLFVHDTRTGRQYRLGEVRDVSSLQWSGDGRSLYFAELNPWGERRIESVRFAAAPTPPDELRVPWEPPDDQRFREIAVASHSIVTRPDAGRLAADPRRGWASGGLPGVRFRYPSDQVAACAEDSVVRIIRTPPTAPDPCRAAADPRPADLLATLQIVPGGCLDLAPRGADRRRLPGVSMQCVLNRGLSARSDEEGVAVDRWWIPMGPQATLLVTRPRPDAPGAPDAQTARALFANFAGSIEIEGMPTP